MRATFRLPASRTNISATQRRTEFAAQGKMIRRLLTATVTLSSLCALRAADHIPPRRSSQMEIGLGGVNTSLPRLPYLPTTERWWTRMFDAGIKYVRIGQYEDTSDITGWDWVEHEKGKLAL